MMVVNYPKTPNCPSSPHTSGALPAWVSLQAETSKKPTAVDTAVTAPPGAKTALCGLVFGKSAEFCWD